MPQKTRIVRFITFAFLSVSVHLSLFTSDQKFTTKFHTFHKIFDSQKKINDRFNNMMKMLIDHEIKRQADNERFIEDLGFSEI